MNELEKPLPALKKRQLSSKQSKLHTQQYGLQGERLAVTFLKREGYHILERNTRLNTTEVDIIAFDTTLNELVFIEVKRRQTAYFGSPSAAVSRRKLHNMFLVARAYQQKHNYRNDVRFDIISIVGNSVSHFKNVTWHTL